MSLTPSLLFALATLSQDPAASPRIAGDLGTDAPPLERLTARGNVTLGGSASGAGFIRADEIQVEYAEGRAASDLPDARGERDAKGRACRRQALSLFELKGDVLICKGADGRMVISAREIRVEGPAADVVRND